MKKYLCIFEKHCFEYAKNNMSKLAKDEVSYFLYSTANLGLLEKAIDENLTIICVIGTNNKLEKVVDIVQKNVKKIYIVEYYAIERKIDFINIDGTTNENVRDVEMDMPYIVHVETHINDYCNLNCKACNNFAPFVKDKLCANYESFSRDIEMLASKYRIGRLYLLGGEPLLEAELALKFIEKSREILKDTEIRLLTNGTLICKMTEQFWNCVKENNVVIFVTVYPPMKDKLAAIEDILVRNGVKYVIGKDADLFMKKLTAKPLENAIHNNHICGSAGCHFFQNGVLTKCPTVELIDYMNRTTENDCRKDLLKIDELKGNWEEVEKIIAPVSLCTYCAVGRAEAIKWESAGTNPNVRDWLIKDRIDFGKENKSLFIKFCEEYDINPDAPVGVWGVGDLFDRFIDCVFVNWNVAYAIDSNQKFWGNKYYGNTIECISPEDFCKKNIQFCFIAIEDEKIVKSISEYLSEYNIKSVAIKDYVRHIPNLFI